MIVTLKEFSATSVVEYDYCVKHGKAVALRYFEIAIYKVDFHSNTIVADDFIYSIASSKLSTVLHPTATEDAAVAGSQVNKNSPILR